VLAHTIGFLGAYRVGNPLASTCVQQPKNLLLETWSYYGSQAPPANEILKYRNEILFGILMWAVVSEIFFFVLEKRREQKK